jgi:glycosyltransferase involved in cell wall biosynthesis
MKDLSRASWRLISYHIWRSGLCTRVKDLFTGISLLVVATLLRWCAYPHRRWLKQVHGDEPLCLCEPPMRGSGLVRFVQMGSAWNRAGFENTVLMSSARWILWQENGADDPLDELLPLFEDERTFAVSWQTHYRLWKPAIVPMAPFRPLQPGTASQVLAPISRTMVVDREKLALLGIPRCSLAVTAWLLLFWKAAAAGWKSYSVGHSGGVSRQPDFPIHETEFFFDVLAKAELRRLSPRDPDLSRGSIAFHPALQRRQNFGSARVKVLVVSPFLPYPLSHGGAVRIFNLCRALADRVDFVLAAVREQQDEVHFGKLAEIFREIYVVDLDESAAKDQQLPTQVRHHQSSSLRALIRAVSCKFRPDLLQIEYTHLAGFRDAAPGVPSILVEHDLTFSLYGQLADRDGGGEARREYEKWRAFEERHLRAFDSVWTMSEEDRRLAIRGGSAPQRTFTIPNGVDIRRFVPGDQIGATPEILYVGSFRHLPNLLGFEKLCVEIMPRVWNRFPEVRLRVVAGPQYEEFSRKFAREVWRHVLDPRITLHGFVEDLRPLYARASAVAVPLEISAGTNIKVMEALACGKAVVTTPAGCAGLGLENRHDALIAPDWETFAMHICDVLSDARLRSRIAAQGRRTAEARFSWTEAAHRAYQSYTELLASTRSANEMRRQSIA